MVAKFVHWGRKLLNKFLEKDVFWMLDCLLVLGGNCRRIEGVWKLTFWYMYHLLAVYQYGIQVLTVVTNLSSWEDQTSTIWSLMSLLTMTLCYVKQFLLWYYRESIHKLRTFIVERQFCSGDSSYDSTVRSGFYRNAQNLVAGIFGLILLDQILIAAPSPLRKRYFGIPSWFYSYGEGTALAVELAFYPTFIIVWVSKLFCSSATVAIVLIGLRTELQILAQYYGRIMKGLQLEVCSDPSKFHRHFHKSPQTRSWFWSQLRLRTGVGVQHHVHLLEYLQLLQPVFEKIFFLIYYQALIVAGAVIYVTIRDEFTVCSVAVLMCMSISVLECYRWCHLVDSFQSVNESLSHHLTNQCSQLPHSADHHSEYVQMRTICMIVAERAHRGVEFSCVGMFTISTAAFANLLNVCYSVLMFLINVCDKVDPVKQFQLWVGSKIGVE